MTATNVIVQRDRVCLITDGAFYDEAGVVLDIASKVTIAPPALHMAIAVSGSVYACHIAAALSGVATQAEAMGRLPQIAAAIKAANIDRHHFAPNLQLFAALWSKQADRAEGWALSTDSAYFGPGYQPGALVEIEQLCVPAVRAGGVNIARFKAFRDGKRLLAEQRRHRHEEGSHYAVGGFGELTFVDRSGVHQERLVTWTDQIGVPIVL